MKTTISEAGALKKVRNAFLNGDLARSLVISGLTPEPKRNRSRHFHEIFEVRLLFKAGLDGGFDYESIRELRLTPAGLVHYGLEPEEIAAARVFLPALKRVLMEHPIAEDMPDELPDE